MLTKSGTGGAPSLTQSFDANNRLIGPGYDANGNTWSAQSGYSVENRMIGSGYWSQYGYDPAGKRVMWQEQAYGTPNNNIQFYFYSITGQRIATVGCVAANDGHPGWWTYPNCNLVGQNVYFGGKLLVSNGVAVATDRLGSVRANAQGEKFRYYPYGEERTSTVNGRDKFGTYFRDLTGMDYADQRYYAPGTGRFGSADPAGAADGTESTSFNRYSYASADPINRADPSGMISCLLDGVNISSCNAQIQQHCENPGWNFIQTGGPADLCTGLNYWGGLPDEGGGSPGLDFGDPAPPRIPCEIDAGAINSYIANNSIYGDPKLSKPLAGMGQAFIDAALQYDTNPAVLVAIAFQESHWGYDQQNKGTNNAFGLLHTDGSFLTFDTWQLKNFQRLQDCR